MTETQRKAIENAQVALAKAGRWAEVNALRAALAEPVGEPVAYRSLLASGSYTYCITNVFFDNAEPLYTAPQAQQPAEVPLKQIAEALRQHGLTLIKKANGYDVMKLGNIEAQEQAVRQKAGLK